MEKGFPNALFCPTFRHLFRFGKFVFLENQKFSNEQKPPNARRARRFSSFFLQKRQAMQIQTFPDFRGWVAARDAI
jgi:hypothetical protein